MTILTLQPDETSGIDAQMNNAASSTNYGTSSALGVGEFDSAAEVYRSLIKFDLSVIPRNARIISAQLTLTITLDRSSNARDEKIYRVLLDWVESEVTWAQWSSGNNWGLGGCSSPGADYDTTVWATLNLGTAETGAKTWNLDVTEFSKMVSGIYPNYGWLIAADTQSNDAYVYASSFYFNADNRPKLVVQYINGGAPAISPFMKF